MAGRVGDNPRAAGPVDKQIGVRIRMRRLELGMSQETLASKLGVTFQQVQKYEKGVNRVAAGTLIDLSEALATPVTQFLPPVGKSESADSMLDDPGAAALLPLLRQLNGDGLRVLTDIARSFAKDPTLGASDKRRRD